MPKVLVTGGGGFIGSAMVLHLLNKGFRVKAFDLAFQVKSTLPDEVEIYKGSILDVNALINAIKGCDYVVHLAAMLGVQRTDAKRLECLNINIQGTINVLEACVKDNIKKLLFTSSSEVYGDQLKIPISEDNPTNPKSIYALSKLTGEEYIKAYHQRYGLDYTIVRFFNVYGPGQVGEFVIPRFVKKVMDNESPQVYGSGKQVRAFCYVDDAVRGAVLALLNEQSNSQIFNIGNETEPISMKELAKKVINLEKREIKLNFIPMKHSDRDEKRDIRRRIPDISKARQTLGYKPKVSLNDGLLRIIKYGSIPNSWADPTEKLQDNSKI
jgi:UDP-glucose 4-epimerase